MNNTIHALVRVSKFKSYFLASSTGLFFDDVKLFSSQKKKQHCCPILVTLQYGVKTIKASLTKNYVSPKNSLLEVLFADPIVLSLYEASICLRVLHIDEQVLNTKCINRYKITPNQNDICIVYSARVLILLHWMIFHCEHFAQSWMNKVKKHR